MKKGIVGLVIVLALLILGEPHIREEIGEIFRIQPILSEEKQLILDAQLGAPSRTDGTDATLYFRFADTDLLGIQQVRLDMRREETRAERIVQLLVEGPDRLHERLTNVFPQGTQVLSVSGEGTTVFVTLSSAFLGKPDGAPSDWEDLAIWQTEAAKRRYLAVQAITLSLTENGQFQRVQMFVASDDDDIPQRIPLIYMDTAVSDPNVVLAPCAREERLVLTPERAMNRILQAWQKQDWKSLYLFVEDSAENPLAVLPIFEEERAEIGNLLLDFDHSAGTIAADGQTATLIVNAQLRDCEGMEISIVKESVPLVRSRDNWVIRQDTLNSLMIRD